VTGKLHAILVDAGHLAVMWDHFRHNLTRMGRNIRPSEVRCALSTLTAAAPPTIANEIGK